MLWREIYTLFKSFLCRLLNQTQSAFIIIGLSIIWFFIPQFRGSEIFELQNFRPATVDDIANVHAKAYVAGLEKVISCSRHSFCFLEFLLSYFLLSWISLYLCFSQAMDQASEQGLIFIEGSGPTYATPTVRDALTGAFFLNSGIFFKPSYFNIMIIWLGKC